mmetsp:Transcript_30174/g.89527  ORF Transcript_30174/g.89527 Transcript_30174/m.89527 type:complete len:232 (+) Transcript_30174:108-803(+)
MPSALYVPWKEMRSPQARLWNMGMDGPVVPDWEVHCLIGAWPSCPVEYAQAPAQARHLVERPWQLRSVAQRQDRVAARIHHLDRRVGGVEARGHDRDGRRAHPRAEVKRRRRAVVPHHQQPTRHVGDTLVGVRKTAGCPADIACAQRVLHRCTAVRHHCTAQLARLEVLQLAGGVVPAAANFARAVSERAVFRHTLCLASHHTRCASLKGTRFGSRVKSQVVAHKKTFGLR